MGIQPLAALSLLLLPGALSLDSAARSATCGAGVGDLRGAAASQRACQACGGRLAFDPSGADSLGYTSCFGGRQPQRGGGGYRGACGTGVGNLSGLVASQAACRACGGRLTFDPAAADGLGYTYCPRGRRLRLGGGGAAPRQEAPEEAAASTSRSADESATVTTAEEQHKELAYTVISTEKGTPISKQDKGPPLVV